ncbi:MAG TPA: hypothetical protein VF310_12525 [Vicinamibacteria bacterium]
MSRHLYLRAYLAGIAVPTAMLLVILVVLVAAHAAGGHALERLLVFPMAVVPNLWGLWNVAYAALRRRGRRWPLGPHGALLPFLLLPAGLLLAGALGLRLYTPLRVATVLPVAVVAYYLAWKHLVGFLNRLVGVEP